MWQSIVDLAIKNGLFAVLFLGLLIYVLRDSKNRENRYQQTIKDLTVSLKVVNDIKIEVNEIKSVIQNKTKEVKRDEIKEL